MAAKVGGKQVILPSLLVQVRPDETRPSSLAVLAQTDGNAMAVDGASELVPIVDTIAAVAGAKLPELTVRVCSETGMHLSALDTVGELSLKIAHQPGIVTAPIGTSSFRDLTVFAREIGFGLVCLMG